MGKIKVKIRWVWSDICKDRTCMFYVIKKFFFLFIAGHEKCYFDRFVVSPDNQYLVFLGKNGYLILVSNKVSGVCAAFNGVKFIGFHTEGDAWKFPFQQKFPLPPPPSPPSPEKKGIVVCLPHPPTPPPPHHPPHHHHHHHNTHTHLTTQPPRLVLPIPQQVFFNTRKIKYIVYKVISLVFRYTH